MVDVEHHRINRQVLEVSLASTTDAIEIQRTLGAAFRSRALPELASVFDRVAGPTRIVRIPRLEIDLGPLEGPDWIDAFVERVVTEVEAALEARPAEGSADPTAPTYQGPTPDVPFERLLFYLEHGHLPWWGARPSPRGAEGSLVPNVDAMVTAQWSALRERLATSGPRLRFVRLRDPELLVRTALELGGLPHTARVCERLTPPHASASAVRRWQETFWDRVLAAVAQGRIGGRRGRALVRALAVERMRWAPAEAHDSSSTKAGPSARASDAPVDSSPPQPDAASEAKTRAPANERSTSEAAANEGSRRTPAEPPTVHALQTPWQPFEDLPAPWHDWVRAERDDEVVAQRAAVARPSSASPETAQSEPRSASSSSSVARADRTSREREPQWTLGAAQSEPRSDSSSSAVARTDRPSRERAPQQTLGADASLPCLGAGVVILHPFVRELFASNGLLDGKQFIDPTRQHLGVRLLAQLAFGTDDVPEHDLLLPKLLCEVPWDDALEPDELRPAHHQACDELLAAVLQHWSALRSSSADWLRAHFLARPGKLQAVDQDWSLRVERHAQDVLLDRLPWGIGFVRLPWMSKSLHVRWTS